jgi:hypothetical protein
MFDFRQVPLLPRRLFLARLAKMVLLGLALIVVSLGVGMFGFHSLEPAPEPPGSLQPMSWLDSFLNSAMLLSGMGPLDHPETSGGKLFAGFYALYSGFAVLIIAGVIAAPVVHRVLHSLHLESAKEAEESE